MTKIFLLIGGLVAGIVVGSLLLSVSPQKEAPAVSGVYNQVSKYFREGLIVGGAGQLTISSTGIVSLGTTSPTSLADIVAEGTGTTTVFIGSSAATSGGCIQMENGAGVSSKIYVNPAGTALVVAAGTCK